MKNQLVAGLLIASLCIPARAEMLSTDAAALGRERASAALQRPEVREQLIARGVDIGEAQARVAALTDEEAALVAAKLEQLPAGAGGGDGIFFLLVAAAAVYVVVTFWPVFVIGGVALVAIKNADRS